MQISDSEHNEDSKVPDSSSVSSGSEGNAGRLPGDSGGNWKAVLVILLLVFAALAGLAFYASNWKQEVAVREIVIEGADIVPRNELSEVLNGYLGKNLQNLDTGAIESKLLAVSYVRRVSIARELNGIIRVKVTEREPLARTVYRNRNMIIDTEGVLLPETPRVSSRFGTLIGVFGIGRTVKGRNAPERLAERDSAVVMSLAEALRESDYARLLIREIHLQPDGLTFCRAAGSSARFVVGSDGNFKEKLKKFEIFWQKVVSKKGTDAFESVDLRFRDRIFTLDTLARQMRQDVVL
ncbi:cell division protein FtsQ/DivIB [Chlorobium sp.]|uniref:cell division protein FtsQ/DivIB n=1 Tax=Chlorobium sp. TaxID=1095 RepID=UPI002F3F9950